MTNATLLAPANARMTREDLKALPTPPVLGPRHKPVSHAALVEGLSETLAANGLRITEEEYACGGRDQARVFGVMKVTPTTFDHPLAVANREDSAYALGLVSGNDKSVAVRISIARSVLVCTNLCISGEIALSKRHTTRLDIGSALSEGVERWIEKQVDMTLLMDQAKSITLTPDQARLRIFKAFEGKILATRYFPYVVESVFNPKPEWTDITGYPNSLWSLHNGFSRALRLAPARVRMEATTRLAGLLRPEWPETN
tara:strand:+ start:5766 stop:6536 length:771 start_codon:yes stop_codon:yes gene_type:complete